MFSRCYLATHPVYKHYGGRGIKVCKRWRDFGLFIDDMGPRPDGTTLDRIDVNKGYDAENCRWATPHEQAINKRPRVIIKFDGRSQSAQEWAKELGIDVATLLVRLRRGWSVQRALTTPPRTYAGSASSAAAHPAPPSPRILHGAGSTASEVQAWLAEGASLGA